MKAGAYLPLLVSLLLALCGHVAAEPLTLEEGVRIVTQDSHVVKIRQQEEKISEADTLIARSRLLPSVNAGAFQSYLEFEPAARLGAGLTAPTAQRDFYGYRLSAQQLLFDFFGASSVYKASKSILETKRLDTKRTKNLVALQFVFLYLDVLESERLIAVVEKEMEALEAQVTLSRDLYAGGVITKNDLLQAEVKLSDARQKLITAKNIRKIGGARLNALLARPPLSSVEVDDPANGSPDAFQLEEGFEVAEKERAEIQIVDLTMKALGYEETARGSEYLPRFLAEGKYDYVKNRYQVHEGYWSVNFLMNINLFSGGATRAEVEKVRSQKLKLGQERKRLIDDIRLEVEKYYLDQVNSTERLGVTEGAIAQAEENLRISRIRYTEGVGVATEVTDAIALLALARTNYFRARYDQQRARAGYAYAIGRDLRDVYP